LVAFSAYETGLGYVQAGEGVYGLHRAFMLAGAKTSVMSLWKVLDHVTQQLMVQFYQQLQAGQSKAEALCLAQLALKALPSCSHPFCWGAFLCQGDPGPLVA
jgi:CHAT domain-containing protein